MERLLEWRHTLRGYKRVAAFMEVEREEMGGELWVVAYCWGSSKAESLFDELWEEGYRLIGRRDHDPLWLSPSS